MKVNREHLRVIFKKDLFSLAKALGLRVDNLADVHYKVEKVSGDRKRKKSKLILLPRGHLKSTLFTVVQAIQDVIRFPYERQLIASATLSLSYSLLSQIRQLCEQYADFLNWVYPEIFYKDPVRESPVWRNNALMFKRDVIHKEATIEIASTEKSITGRHYDIIRLDDVVAEANSGTDEQLKKVIEWYQMLSPIIDKRYYGKIHITGTRWHLNDLYGWILENESDNYDILVYKAHNEDYTEILWGENFSRGDFEQLQKTMSAYQYSCQYLNQPLAEDTQIFFEEMFHYDSLPDIDRSEYNIVMTVDPAISEKDSACDSAIVVMAYFNNSMYQLTSWTGKVSSLGLIEKIIEMMVRYDVDVIGIETVAYQKALKEILVEKIMDSGLDLPIIEELKPDKDKVRRAYAMSPYVAQGRVFLDVKDRKLIKQLCEFPQGRMNDLVDAFVYHAYLFPKYNVVVSRQRESYEVVNGFTTRQVLDKLFQKYIRRREEGYDFSK